MLADAEARHPSSTGRDRRSVDARPPRWSRDQAGNTLFGCRADDGEGGANTTSVGARGYICVALSAPGSPFCPEGCAFSSSDGPFLQHHPALVCHLLVRAIPPRFIPFSKCGSVSWLMGRRPGACLARLFFSPGGAVLHRAVPDLGNSLCRKDFDARWLAALHFILRGRLLY